MSSNGRGCAAGVPLVYPRSTRLAILLAVSAVLGACASASDTVLTAPPAVRPKPLPLTPASTGSLFPTALGQGIPRPLFEDRRARGVGDTLQVVIEESNIANRASNNRASREASVGFEIPTATKVPLAKGVSGSALEAQSAVDFSGDSASAARNTFRGQMMVMITQILPNGNFVVAGEKQIAIGKEEEVIRFSGIVNPADLIRNSISSNRVADARLEYRGRGAGDDATQAGWLTRGLLKVWPF